MAKNLIKVPVKMGDVIAFDSRIWHRSAKNTSGQNRFALVTRWSRSNHPLSLDIPERIPAYFGMWTCAKVTESLLKKGLEKLSQQAVDADFATIIKLWQKQLTYQKKLPLISIPPNPKSPSRGLYSSLRCHLSQWRRRPR
ncbi:phytanoyl-CoA dioxygenase family protein (plasmid) [Candidatus Arsenophonus nilaparvatae]|uniref:phytanoyl-CoA dioxygenase family protein n=1 Tax=Candidatus Arsenophonus nilaparvatae TaxID=1247023 RepID=UPI0037BE4AAA